MDATVGLLLLTLLCASVGSTHGECRHVRNEDLVEYSCVGGHPSDLDALPQTTGKIRIMNMHIPRITSDMFSRFGSELWVLSCSHCGIEDIEPDAFHQLDNLQQLSLDNNRLTTIRAEWFKGLDYLTFLDLNYNNIENIEDGVFTNLPSLVDLRLSGNRIECLNLKDMSSLKDLRRIFLTENSELKCPNAVSRFLEDRGVSFDKDPEWRRIPTDVVPVDLPIEAPPQYAPPIWETTTPSFRERLYTVPTPTASPETPRYYPTRYYPTEEIFYPPEIVTPSWTVTSEPVPQSHDVLTTTPEPTTRRTYYDDVRMSYVPPQTVSPPKMMTPPPYVVTPPNLDETTVRPWPAATDPGSQRPEYPPRGNENKQYGAVAPKLSESVTGPPFLASSPVYHQETSRFGEADTEHSTDPYKTYWTPNEDDLSFAARYPVDDGNSDYALPVTEVPDQNAMHVILPRPSAVPEESQPSSPDDFFQAPYYEPTVTIRPPPLENYQQRQEETTSGVSSIETTTDKPLPECPNRSSLRSIDQSLQLILLSLLLVGIGNVLVEGF